MDYGNFVSGSSTAPYIQLLPLTNITAARKDFVNVRMGGVDTISSQTLLPADQGKVSPLEPGEARQHLEEKVISRWPEILGGCLGALVLIVGIIVWRCCCRRPAKKRQPLGKKPLSLTGNMKDGKDLHSGFPAPADSRLSQLPRTYMHLNDRAGSNTSIPQSLSTPTVAQAYDPQQNAEFLQQTYGHPGTRQPRTEPPENAIYKPSYQHSQPDHYDDQTQYSHHQQGSNHSYEQAAYEQSYDQQYPHPQSAPYSDPSYGWNQSAEAIQHPPSAAAPMNYAGRGTQAATGQNRAGFGAVGY
jgi:hypothetical protein